MLRVGNVLEAPTNIKGSGINSITRLIHHPFQTGQMISIGHDGFIKIWNLSSLNEISRKQMKTPYLTSIIPLLDGFLLGMGNGKLVHLDQNLEIIKEYKIHDDCLTDVIEI